VILATPVQALNNADQDGAQSMLQPCCASHTWIAAVADGRPFRDLDHLVSVSDTALAALRWPDVLQALAAHPRIGQRAAGTDRESSWSRSEQSGVTEDARELLADQNVAYQDRFGYVFLICATGMSADAMLAQLTRRLANDPVSEQAVVRTELVKIVRLRLAKAFG
jgi:2-oxo-4-hydroxy-4-carboxy-5-ureidoimidazoline decarboxylase